MQGWTENGTPVQPFTTLARFFERSTGEAPFAVPASWSKAKPRLDLNTRFDLSTNNDIIGGNSGSPLIDAKGEIVGLVFDGNIHWISGSYWFDEKLNRTVAVHPAMIYEALGEGLQREESVAGVAAAGDVRVALRVSVRRRCRPGFGL